VLLELLTGKRPTDPMFVGDLRIRKWVCQAFPTELDSVVDEQLLLGASSSAYNVHDFLSPIFEVGLLCSSDSPDRRMLMKDVTVALKKVRKDCTESTSATAQSAAL